MILTSRRQQRQSFFGKIMIGSKVSTPMRTIAGTVRRPCTTAAPTRFKKTEKSAVKVSMVYRHRNGTLSSFLDESSKWTTRKTTPSSQGQTTLETLALNLKKTRLRLRISTHAFSKMRKQKGTPGLTLRKSFASKAMKHSSVPTMQQPHCSKTTVTLPKLACHDQRQLTPVNGHT